MAHLQRKRAGPRRLPNVAAVALRAEQRIVFVRGYKALLDADLADLYEVPTRRLNEQVRRNKSRFPPDFMLELSAEEYAALRSQSAISKPGRGGRRHLPLAFTEQGVAMLSSVLRSERAVQVNIAIMRAFVRLREMLASNRDLARKLEQMEHRYDAQFKAVFDAIRTLIDAPPRKAGRIGYRTERP
jgi:hypothetical protein